MKRGACVPLSFLYTLQRDDKNPERVGGLRILVTGAGGFIGSHLTERLAEDGHEVRAFVRYNSLLARGWLEGSPSAGGVEIFAGDIRDMDSVRRAMEGREAVFHLASLIGIPYSYLSPLAYIKTNTEGTYNVLEAARDLGVARVVHTSTSEIYGTAQYVPINEKHPVNPQSPYAATKAAADQMALAYCRSFGLPVTVVRPFNTYGPRQSARAVIPTIVSQLLAGRAKIRLGSVTPTRDLNFVSDTVNGFVTIGLAEAAAGEIVNLGSGKEISVGDLARKIARIIGRELEIEQDPARMRPEKSEVERLLADASKAYSLTGWKPEVTLEDGLRRTIEWIAERRGRYREGEYNV